MLLIGCIIWFNWLMWIISFQWWFFKLDISLLNISAFEKEKWKLMGLKTNQNEFLSRILMLPVGH